MAMRDLLVVVDDTPGAAARMEVAATLARDNDAHVTGLWVSDPVNMPVAVAVEIPDALLRQFEERAVEKAAAAKAGFEEVMARFGIAAKSEWRQVEGDPTAVTAVHGRYADLVIVGQVAPDRDDDTAVVIPEDLLFDCGRPLLVVPHVGHFPTVGQRIIVGWNASREAARAVGDAMDLLTRAHKVAVMAVNPKRKGLHGLGDAPGADIAHHLSRHGCKVEAAQTANDQIDPGDTLLNLISDTSSDMVVMGAYGRSRLREMVLGGMTRFMLRHATVPLFMSH